MNRSLRRQVCWGLLKTFGILGLLFCSYVLGAAAMYLELPWAHGLQQAFKGGAAWVVKHQDTAQNKEPPPPVTSSTESDDPSSTYDGFTLIATPQRSQASLVNMRGDVVHKWSARFSEVWPEKKLPHITGGIPQPDNAVHFWGCRVFPNGDLLAVMWGLNDTPYGYGLVKLDRDSKVRWRYTANVHHEFDIGDDGRIYALTQKIVKEVPQGLEFIPTPCLVDYVVVLSPDGEELEKVPVLEAFRDSPFAGFLAAAAQFGKNPLTLNPTGTDPDLGDITHVNSVQVLTAAQARATGIPGVKGGQVLISLRNLSILAVMDLDPAQRRVVWAARGPWANQHSPLFLDDGRLLVFDNAGSGSGSRVLELDPLSGALVWSYPEDPDTSELNVPEVGKIQRLPNGNTLIVNPERPYGILEVTRDHRIVWLHTVSAVGNTQAGVVGRMGGSLSARRYAADEVPFLDGIRPREPRAK